MRYLALLWIAGQNSQKSMLACTLHLTHYILRHTKYFSGILNSMVEWVLECNTFGVMAALSRSFFIFVPATRKERTMYFITVVLWMREERKRRRRNTWPGCIGITEGQREEEDQEVTMKMLTTEN